VNTCRRKAGNEPPDASPDPRKDQFGMAIPNVHFDDHVNDIAMRTTLISLNPMELTLPPELSKTLGGNSHLASLKDGHIYRQVAELPLGRI
jgi:hypothetical protein